MTRSVVAVLFIVLASSCGGNEDRSVAPRSVAEVRTTFAKHGIELVRLEPFGAIGPMRRSPSTSFSGSLGDFEVTVDIYPTLDRKGTSLLLGNGPPHYARARNVVAYWLGPDSPRVEAAVGDLR
jgi:hypothetical protein